CKHYWEHFKGKTILCNCDDPRVSNFFRYFSLKFEDLGLKKLIATCYKSNQIEMFSQQNTERAVYIEYYGDKNGNRQVDDNELEVKELQGDGDFRSAECIELLKEADIVVTNPPFSLFREYVAQLIEYEKKFLIIGNKNALTYKEIFTLIKANKIWTGVRGFSGGMWFKSDYEGKTEKIIKDLEGNTERIINVPSIWFTNLDHKKRHEELILYKNYTPEEYPKYDNYDAIEVKKTAEIPMNYNGVMGVPITFLDKYNPEQFEILGLDDHRVQWRGRGPEINGKCVYRRIIIKKK
ncbi:MAG: adenine-specific methyltransferase EcoRI family protein, partial [Bacteroidales bacterium]|nr:adenine-specific methyltransferase EcoRI family protein [Bacteroidales bacterium]